MTEKREYVRQVVAYANYFKDFKNETFILQTYNSRMFARIRRAGGREYFCSASFHYFQFAVFYSDRKDFYNNTF